MQTDHYFYLLNFYATHLPYKAIHGLCFTSNNYNSLTLIMKNRIKLLLQYAIQTRNDHLVNCNQTFAKLSLKAIIKVITKF